METMELYPAPLHAQVPLESDASNSPDPENSVLTDQVAIFHDHLSREHYKFITAQQHCSTVHEECVFVSLSPLKKKRTINR